MKFTVFHVKRAVAISTFFLCCVRRRGKVKSEMCIGEEKHLEFKKSVPCLEVSSYPGSHSCHVSSTKTRCRREFADYVTRMSGVYRNGNVDRAVHTGETFGDSESFYFMSCSNAFYDEPALKK
jgi:hypothetical protein